ncbi:MAG: ATP-binding protein [Bacteroidota bacterium]
MKITVKYLLLMLSLVLSFYMLSFITFEYYIIPWHIDSMKQKARELAQNLQKVTPYINTMEEQALFEKLIKINKDLSYLLIVDKNGKALVHGDSTRRGMVFNDDGTLYAASHNQEKIQIYTRDANNPDSPYYGEKVIDIFVPYLDSANVQAGAINVGLSLHSVYAVNEKYNIFMMVFSLLILLIAVAITMKIFRDFIGPVKQLSEAAVRFKDTGEINIIEVRTNDELGILVHHFNEMEKNIHELINTLKNNEDELQKYINQLYSFTAKLDTEGRVLLINDTAVRSSSSSREKIIGQKFWELNFWNFSADVQKNLREQISSAARGETLRFESMSIVSNRMVTVDVSVKPVADDSGRIVYLIAEGRDISDIKNTQRELVRAKEKAEISDRLKSEFLAQVSHEIRTPINTILSFASLLKLELESLISNDLADGFNIIENGGKRLIRTIDLILNMSEVQTGHYDLNMQEMDLYKNILMNIYTEFNVNAQVKGLEFSIKNESGNSRVYCDHYTVTQIFVNLIDNAIKYTKEGRISVCLHQSDRQLVVDVTDTGIGISEEYMKNLFTPFSQEESGYTRRFEGNGLGLALVKKYCELNNAEISVKSTKGQGTTFSVSFPLHT